MKAKKYRRYDQMVQQNMDGNIRQETYVFRRQMTPEEQENYERIVADSNQMTIFDFIEQ